MSDYIRQHSTRQNFDQNSWCILSEIEQSIKRKIEAVGKPLKDWDVSINYGIKTGCNEAFIIDGETKDALIAQDPKSAEIIRPILRGKDIKRYGYTFADKWLIATHNGTDNTPCVNIEHYPAVKAHLDSYYAKIEQREDQGSTPYNLRSCAYWDDFSKQKIIFPNMTKFLPFVFDDSSYLTNQKCFIVVGKNVAFLTAFLNSSLFKFCFRDSFPELQGGTRELSKIFFEKLPIIPINDEINVNFENAVTDIQSLYTKEKAIKIDGMIFDLYGLSKEERISIGFIEIK